MPPEPPIDPVLGAFVGGVILSSVATFLYVASRYWHGPVLPFEPRRPVPWGAPAAILAVVFVIMAVLPAVGAGDAGEPGAERDAADMAAGLLGLIISELAIVGPFLFAVIVLSAATPRDLGLPANEREFGRDILIGVVACLAVLAPIVLLQALLMNLFHLKESGHELVKMVIEGKPNLIVLVLASVAAVAIAPVCEEIMFRLLLQGWLEKWEDERLGWRNATAVHDSTTVVDVAPEINDEARMTNDENVEGSNLPFDTHHSSLETNDAVAEEVPTSPPVRGIAGMPYGWLPILISSLLFAAAHFGYGPEPVPLFFLALVLGYVYQRTHRIVPGIVIHAMFNGFTMVILWRMALGGAE
jgi:membrane protease YdiL (CAAX protease family)